MGYRPRVLELGAHSHKVSNRLHHLHIAVGAHGIGGEPDLGEPLVGGVGVRHHFHPTPVGLVVGEGVARPIGAEAEGEPYMRGAKMVSRFRAMVDS